MANSNQTMLSFSPVKADDGSTPWICAIEQVIRAARELNCDARDLRVVVNAEIARLSSDALFLATYRRTHVNVSVNNDGQITVGATTLDPADFGVRVHG